MFVKICGMTRIADAVHAAAHGADAVGFVFWAESPRYVPPALAAEIISALPRRVNPVGVFVDEPVETIRAIVEQTGIRIVQLHGNETPNYGAALDTPLLRAIDVNGAEEAFAAWPADTTFLLDAHDPVRRGGTGVRVDWERAADIARLRRTVLAGGLTDVNVAAAVEVVRPFGVDVSSGVEDAPGVKNPDKVTRFLESARSALEQLETRPR